MRDAVLAYLIERQSSERLTGAAMAQRLGMGETQWSHIRRGRANLTAEHIDRAIQLYPEIAERLAEAAREQARVPA